MLLICKHDGLFTNKVLLMEEKKYFCYSLEKYKSKLIRINNYEIKHCATTNLANSLKSYCLTLS